MMQRSGVDVDLILIEKLLLSEPASCPVRQSGREQEPLHKGARLQRTMMSKQHFAGAGGEEAERGRDGAGAAGE